MSSTSYYVSIKEAAKILDVPRHHVLDMVEAGLTCWRIGKRIRIPRCALDDSALVLVPILRYDRRRRLKEKYGLTVEQFDAMLKTQKGLCAICGRPPSGKGQCGKSPVLHVDHDHATGKVRGLLCPQCNQALGKFRDDVEILTSAIDYLDRSRIES